MLSGTIGWAAIQLLKRDASDADSDEPEAGQKEIFASWSLFILIFLLIVALFTSYFLQARRIQAVHETVISIFAGMAVGLMLRLTAADSVLGLVSFDYQFFFNLLLPPIILASGYELHQANFFRNIGTILTFAFAGTFISAVVLGIILYVWAWLPIESMELSFVEAMAVGATLSATDPVTILAIFNTYKVDPKLYTIIFGESILNDAVAIVLFETAQRYKTSTSIAGDADTPSSKAGGSITTFKILESLGVFLLVFFGSLMIGVLVGIGTSLLLKFTHVRRFPKIESCIILLIAYASYFFANAIHMSGIVSLLFCGICLKHYAYHNMSRRTQLTTKFIFQVLSQLSENFIFIYLGLSLFTEPGLDFRPLFILVTVGGICVARGLAVFPLSRLINLVLRYRARRFGHEETGEIPFPHQAMLFWAGLRGAVGVALAAGLQGPNSFVLRATVLIVVVLTVIIFGGTTARMLEILGIRTGVADEPDSDDEFDIEVVPNGTYGRKPYNNNDNANSYDYYGNTPNKKATLTGRNGIALADTAHPNIRPSGPNRDASYSSGTNSANLPSGVASPRRFSNRTNTNLDAIHPALPLLDHTDSNDYEADLDLPPTARRPQLHSEIGRTTSAPPVPGALPTTGGSEVHGVGGVAGMAGGLRHFLAEGLHSVEDPAQWFRQLDEEFIKPKLLLDPGDGAGRGGGVV